MSSYLRLDDGTTWPDPADPDGVQWHLRYGEPTREHLLFAASVLAAYSELGFARRGSRLAGLRRAAKAAAVGRRNALRDARAARLRGQPVETGTP